MEDSIKHRKHLFFDLDETVTPSRSPIMPHMAELLGSLPTDIIIVSGGEVPRIRMQLAGTPAYALGQNGNHAVGRDGEEYWRDDLSPEESAEILAHIEELKKLGIDGLIQSDCIEHRGSQICFSILGHNAPIALKKAADPTMERRQALLRERPFNSDSVEVRIGGTTTLDYFRKGSHKGSNVARLIDQLGWKKEDSIYFGDKLMPGGNDEAVVGVIDTVPVEDSEHTYEILKKAFER
jgi:phosphomannomutase